MTQKTRAAGSAAERTLDLISLLASHGKALSLAALSESLNLPKATVHRLTTQLVETGFIARSEEDKAFFIGPALRKLAIDTLNHDTTQGLRHAVLANLVNHVGETCNFTTLDGASVRYLDRVEASWPWRLTLEVGAQVPLHCTASGKLFLANLTEAQRKKMLATLPLSKMTDHTLTDVVALEKECAQIVRLNYAVDQQEFILGLNAIAVPVKNTQGRVVGGIAIHAPTSRLSIDKAKQHLPALEDAAKRMAALL